MLTVLADRCAGMMLIVLADGCAGIMLTVLARRMCWYDAYSLW